MKASQSVRTWALIKSATFQYSDGPHGEHNQTVRIGKTLPGTITAVPRKGQKITPLKHSNVPFELREKLRRLSSKTLGRKLEKSGGPTSKDGQAYAAVLEERAVNPNLAPKNTRMAKVIPNDVFNPQTKQASYIRIYNLLNNS